MQYMFTQYRSQWGLLVEVEILNNRNAYLLCSIFSFFLQVKTASSTITNSIDHYSVVLLAQVTRGWVSILKGCSHCVIMHESMHLCGLCTMGDCVVLAYWLLYILAKDLCYKEKVKYETDFSKFKGLVIPWSTVPIPGLVILILMHFSNWI